MERFRKKRILLSSVIILSSVTSLVLLFVGIFLFYARSRRKKVSEKVEPEFYQYTSYDPNSGIVEKGYTYSFAKLGAHGFVSYNNDETDEYVLINHLGSSVYGCTGNCYCDNSDHEDNINFGSGRRTTSVIGRSLTLLVSAITSAAAIELARNGFEERCRNNEEGFCSSQESIRSEVDSCHKLSSAEEVENEDEDRVPTFRPRKDSTEPGMVEEWDPNFYEEDGTGFEDYKAFNTMYEKYETDVFEDDAFEIDRTREYICQGRCVPNIYSFEETFHRSVKMREVNHEECKMYGCEEIDLKMLVFFDDYVVSTDPEIEGDTDESIEEKVKEEFIHTHLQVYCAQTSWKVVAHQSKWMCNTPMVDEMHPCDDFFLYDQYAAEDHVGKTSRCYKCEDSFLHRLLMEKPMCSSGKEDGTNDSVTCRYIGMWNGRKRMKYLD